MVQAATGSGLEYYVVDVFTSVPYAGNPLALVLGADHLTTEQMQQMALEFHLSETAFPIAPTDDERARGVAYRLRIFTPEVELPFAGHPSVGTAWVMARLGRVPVGTVVQACGAGELPLTVAPDGGPVELTGGTPTWSEPVDPLPLLAAVGLDATDLDAADGRAARVCGTGLGYGIVSVRPDALARCVPDAGRLSAFAHPVSEATGVYVVAWDGAARLARARMFAGDVGVLEDAATGSAALALGVWLVVSGQVAAGHGPSSTGYEVRQGVEMGRPAVLSCTVEAGDGVPTSVRVKGDVVFVAKGRISPPSP
ncbi:MAG TPA: PhzF family phenazine biosynthesis protein [Actinomycetes bacterium]